MFIAISQRLVQHQAYCEMREALSLEWGAFFQSHLQDFLPLPLSYSIPFSRYAKNIRGCILSGGNDLSIFQACSENELRDAYEKKMIEYCATHCIPILGICRGAQLLAHFFGSHLQAIQNHVGAHLAQDGAGQVFEVNSFHNYAITELGSSLKCLVRAKDGSIEAFRHLHLPFYAMMWHCERPKGMDYPNIFQAFQNELLNQEKY